MALNHAYELSLEERKSFCWYSDSELVPSREDARLAMSALHEVDGDVDAVHPNKGVCLRGLEKYADAVVKVMMQRRLIESVLRQQRLNRDKKMVGDEHIANVSRYLSQPFKDVARYYAVKTAEDEQRTHSQQQQGEEEVDRNPSWNLIQQVETKNKRSRSEFFQEAPLHRRSVKQCVQVSE